jgi:hypothetical protein
VLTTSGTYPWPFVTQIFHNGQPSHGGDRKTFEGNLGSVASLLAAYEADFIQELLRKNEKKLARSFNFTFLYIDDVLSLNNSRLGDFVVHQSVLAFSNKIRYVRKSQMFTQTSI